MMMNALNVKFNEIPYKGTGPALTDLMGGQVDLMCDQTSGTVPSVKADKIKAYAAVGKSRLSGLPDLPAIAEAGVQGFDITISFGLYAPKGTPKPVMDQLTTAPRGFARAFEIRNGQPEQPAHQGRSESQLSNWLTLVVTLVIQAMVSMALLTLPVMAPVVAQDMQVSPALVGLYVSMTYAGAMVASLMGGAMVNRLGAIRVSQWGLLLCAAGLLLCAAPWFPAMGLGAVLIGLGYGPITPASSHILARTTPKHQMSLVFSLKQTGVPLGSLLAGAIVPSMLLALSWHSSLAAVAAVCVLCAALSQPLRAGLDQDRQPDLQIRWGSWVTPIRMVLAHRTLTTMAACSFMFSMVQLSLTTYLVTFLHDDLAYGLVAAGLALSAT
jgi:Tripartite tricarboxylate transporter family receptor/Major Facilitator Superfamily